jgi:predicted dehydrogenase
MEERDMLAAARGDDRGSAGSLKVPPAHPRVGIVGAGFIGAVHARSARLAGAHLAGVATSTAERSLEAAARLGAERAYASPADLVASDDVEVVHICSPNATHAELATRALEHGKHVVCEKPLAVSSGEADGLVRALASSGRVGTVPFVYRFHPVVREARARVRSGSLGPVRLITGGYLQDWLASAEDDNWRVDAAQGGPSRAFADIGSHWCDLMEFITGERITAICAQTATVFGERADGGAARAFAASGSNGSRRAVSTEDAVTAVFRTDSGAHGTLAVSQVSPGRKNHLHVEIACAEASVRFEQERPETLWLGRRGVSEIVTRDPGGLGAEAAPYAVAPAGHPQGYLDCFDLFVADSYAAMRGEGAPLGLPTFADGARSAHLIDAVLASAAAGEWVEVP